MREISVVEKVDTSAIIPNAVHITTKSKVSLTFKVQSNTVKVPISRYSQEAEKLSATGVGHLQECEKYRVYSHVYEKHV